VATSTKRKRGRPHKTIPKAYISLGLPTALLDRIEDWAKQKRIQRPEAIRRLVERGLEKK
jgi:hypothetical protein